MRVIGNKIFSLMVLIILILSSCTSLKDFDAGEQPEVYTTEYPEEEYISEKLNIDEEINNFVENIEVENLELTEDNYENLLEIAKSLYDEVSYYRHQTIPEVEPVFIDLASLNENSSTKSKRSKSRSR